MSQVSAAPPATWQSASVLQPGAHSNVLPPHACPAGQASFDGEHSPQRPLFASQTAPLGDDAQSA